MVCAKPRAPRPSSSVRGVRGCRRPTAVQSQTALVSWRGLYGELHVECLTSVPPRVDDLAPIRRQWHWTVGDDPAPVLQSLRSEEHTSELQSRFDLVCRL